MFIRALILFFLVLITYSLIESFNRPIIEGLKVGKKKKKVKNAKTGVIEEVDDEEDAVAPATGAPAKVPEKASTAPAKASAPQQQPAKASAPPPTATQAPQPIAPDVGPRLNEFDARIKELNTRMTNVETQIQGIQTGLAASQQATVDVAEEDDTEDV